MSDWKISKSGNKITSCVKPLPFGFDTLQVHLYLNSEHYNHSAGPGWYATLNYAYVHTIQLGKLDAKNYKQAMTDAEQLARDWLSKLKENI